MMPNTKYQGYTACGFRQEVVSCFPYIRLCKTCDPRSGPFCPKGRSLNKHGRGPIGGGYTY